MQRLVTFITVLVAFGSVQSTTIHVPADQPTIQAGIDAAIAGDTVLVAPGTYTGDGNRDIDFGGKGIDLKSENGPEVTIIDCEGSYSTRHRGFYFHSGEDSSAVVDGFTIQGGYGWTGGGIYCYFSSPTIINNNISGNSAGDYGGGIYCSTSDPTISNNIISGNSASRGGGIYCSHSSDPTISNNTISENSADDGGGVYCDNSNPIISNNFISRNVACFEPGVGAGGGICCYDSSPTIINNFISRNSAGTSGGIYCQLSDPTISNNTISGNSGGGIYCYWGSSPVITNTIIRANSGWQVGGGSPVVTYCDIQGGWEGEGNIDADPLFVSPYDGNICSQSPCIDAGDPSMLDPDGSRSDIGRFFSEHPECSLGNIWYVSTAGSDTSGDGSPGNPFRTIQYGVDVSLSSDTVIVASGTYVERVTIWGKSILLASEYLFTGDTLDIQNTIIDPAGGSVVTLLGCDSLSGLTGFTIQGGYTSYGGGILCFNSNPTISNNIISGNSATSFGGYGGYGGGVYCSNSNPTIINNTIIGNWAVWWGGGIACSNSNPTISNNTISGNSTGGYGAGGGIYCSNSNSTINNNSISGNSAGRWGGGGIYCSNSSPVITNTILAFNRSSSGPISCYNSSPTLTCCDVYGNEGGDWVDCIADQAGINGNFSADPLFCYRAAGDFHLSSISPCAAENNDCGELIGALGVACDPFLCGDANSDGAVTIMDMLLVRAYYFLGGPPPLPLLSGDVNCSGHVDIGDIVRFADHFFRQGELTCCR